jgi:predicted Holliday junction resolvase-like endonuclease
MYLFRTLFALCFIVTCCSATTRGIKNGNVDPWLDHDGSPFYDENLWKMINELKQTSQAQQVQLTELNEKVNQQEKTSQTQATKLNELEQKNSQLQEEILERQPKICQGRTSYTQWKPYNGGRHGITVHVNTSHCQFRAVPVYFTSLGGTTSHWTTTGMTSIYAESKTGFDIYLWTTETGKPEPNDQTLAMMAVRQWELNWIGVEKN